MSNQDLPEESKDPPLDHTTQANSDLNFVDKVNTRLKGGTTRKGGATKDVVSVETGV